MADKVDVSDIRSTAAVFLLLGCLITPIGVGTLFGAGYGWITLAVVLILLGFRLAFVADKEKKKSL